jgi:spore coat protein SA
LHLGSLVRLKGQDVFLTAAQALAAAHPQVFFLMVGSPLGDHEPDYARAVIARAQAAGPAFRYVPALADPRPAFAAADVLVQTSAWPEAFGMVLLEAMACAKPVIAPRQGGPLEVVEDGVTGFLFDPKRVDELVAALRALVTQPDLRERMGAAGRRRLDGHFTRRRQVRALLELYRELTPDLTAC